MCIITWIERNKDFFLVIAALLAPFAAVFVGLAAAKKQSKALIESTTLQVRSAALRDVRQRSLEKLRDELAAQVYAIIELKDFLRMSPTDTDEIWRKMGPIEARKFRIRLTVSSASKTQYDQWSNEENNIWWKIVAIKKGDKFSAEHASALEDDIERLAAIGSGILSVEEQRAASFD